MSNKKEALYVIVIVTLVGLCGQFYWTFHYKPEHQIAVYYNHDHALNVEIVDRIKEADKFVYFSVYTFTRQDIKDALLAAKYRGLKVTGLTDRDQYNQIEIQRKIIDELRKDGIPVYTQDHVGIMHTKVLVTEKAYASGSFNWTAAATNINDEVLEVGTDESIRKEYQNILEEMLGKYEDLKQ
jgi:phosphatidylserine/phosphatidylglycerophosphate/cardiolipin synthase-like enzyme